MGGLYEGDIIDYIHEESYIPGLVRAMRHGYARDSNGDFIMGPPGASHPQKINLLVLADVGLHLDTCGNVYKFLRIMHDALSAQINMYAMRKILHRNINDEHIMISGSVSPKERANYNAKKTWAPYIKEILGEFNPEDGAETLSECLIINLRYCTLVGPSGYMGNLRQEKMGTPRFMARSVARQDLLLQDRNMIFRPMPNFDSETDVRYTQYRKLSGLHYRSYTHFMKEAFAKHKDEKPGKYWQQFIHDAESTLWVITSWLVRAFPSASTQQYANTPAYKTICEALCTTPPEDRVLYPAVSDWAKFLHPSLSSLAGMLSEMHQYLLPDWGRFDLLPRPDHAHEALRRIIFRQIVRMSDSGEHIGVKQRKRDIHPEVEKKMPVLVDD